MRRWIACVSTVTLLITCISVVAEARPFRPVVKPLSPSATNPAVGGNDDSFGANLSPNGRYAVVFTAATDLLSGVTDTNGSFDLYWRDLRRNVTKLVTHAAGNQSMTADAGALSAGVPTDDGSVFFNSNSSNLVPVFFDQNGGIPDAYRWNTRTGVTTLLTHVAGNTAMGGGGFPLSFKPTRNGAFMVLNYTMTDLTGTIDHNGGNSDVFLLNIRRGTTTLVSRSLSSPMDSADSGSSYSGVSSNGRTVVFTSNADDIVAGDVGGHFDAFVYNVFSDKSKLLTSAAGQPNVPADDDSPIASISVDARYVVVQSSASNLLNAPITDNNSSARDAFLFDRKTGRRTLASHAVGNRFATGDQAVLFALVARNGSVLFASASTNYMSQFVDGNGAPDDFVYSPKNARVQLVDHAVNSLSQTVNQAAGVASPQSASSFAHLCFLTSATDAASNVDASSPGSDAYEWTARTGKVTLISHAFGQPLTGVGDVSLANPSSDGKNVPFTTDASGVAAGFTPVGANLNGYVLLRRRP